ncbi:MAG: tetratricopeptide repeat protein, partial [Symploca sp. SIO2E6]|nr:tetratricopeptide repeat protein [Symploca sp. SIO2E6]
MMLKKALQIALIALPLTFSELWLLDFGVRLPRVEVVAQTVDERKLEADRLFEEGKKQFSNSQFEEALQLWQQALVIYRETGDRRGEAYSLFNLGDAHRSLAEYERATDFLEQSLAIFREIGDRQGEAYSLNNLANVYDNLAEYERAINLR